MINLVLKLFLVLTISKQFNAEQKQYDDKKCLELGYRKTELQCDKCSELVKFDLNDLKEDCEACCTISNEEKTIKKTYKNARLEICNCKLGYYPQIHAFMKERSKQFKNLVVKHVPGAEPVIKLIDDNNVVQEKLSIQKWNTDTIEEFFKEHLVMS